MGKSKPVGQFMDKEGTKWIVRFTVNKAIQLKAEKGIDLLDRDSLADSIDDLFQRFNLLWCACSRQAKEAGVDIDDFDELLADGGVFVASSRALEEALIDFFLRCGKKALAEVVRQAVEAARALEDEAEENLRSSKGRKAIAKVVREASGVDKMGEKFDKILGNTGESSGSLSAT